MSIAPAVLLVELLMSADRLITAAQQATFTVQPDEWPAATILGHVSLVDTQVWLPRIEMMTAADAGGGAIEPPVFTWWEPDATVTQAHFADYTVDEAGAALLAGRTGILHRLRELPEGSWSAQAQHEVFGLIDVQGLLLQILAHDEEHRSSLLIGSR